MTHSTQSHGHYPRAQALVAGLFWFTIVPLVTAQQAGPTPIEDGEQHARQMAQGLVLFKSDVRPLLVELCLPCHGGGPTLGDLDLSTREALARSGKLGQNADSSRLLELIRHEQEPHMPFQQPKLPQEAIRAIARWVELGAPYDKPLVDKPVAEQRAEVTDADRQFWSFRPLARSTPPATGDPNWSRTPIDRFILNKLDEKGLDPNPEAGRRTLIRRAYLDLLGLPPEPEAVDHFVNDRSPDAYEKLIDRLLESRHFGERWARHWMDIARFAESYGFEKDFDRPYAYHYRDFLIKAFNRDMPYDRFVRWQLAGDELAPDNPLALMATGFLGAGAFPTEITEHEFETVRYDELDDMVGTIGTAMLGLTIGCARCHDHKYDPIPTRDYYRLTSTFGHTIRTEIDYDPSPETSRASLAKWEAGYRERVAARSEYEQRQLAEPFAKWLDNAAGGPPDDPWQVLDLTEYESKEGATFEKLEDGSILASGENPDLDYYTFTTDIRTRDIHALRLEALTHPSFPHNGPGRSRSGRFRISSLTATAKALTDPNAESIELEFSSRQTTDSPDPGTTPAVFGTNVVNTGWHPSSESAGLDHAAAFGLAKPFGFEDGTRLTIKLSFSKHIQFSLGRLRFSISSEKRPSLNVGTGVPQQVVEGLGVLEREGPGGLSKRERAALLRWFAQSDPRWRALDQAVQSHLFARPVPTKTKIQVTSEGFPIPRHNSNGNGYPHFYERTHFLKRGDVSQKGEPANPGFLRVLMQNGSDSRRWLAPPPQGWARTSFQRASLADWMTDVDNGAGALLARVMVNRLWHHHFGTGIVATPSDFGRQGDRPSHPELLDWLAQGLIDHGWQLKRLHKLIMTSAVYRQSAAHDPDKSAVDVNNVYRWRWTPRRLEAEAIRDSLLTVSGFLDRRMCGPGSLRPDMRRRSIYFFIKRAELVPQMMLFDWPEQLIGIGRRPSTTVAPQALMFLNSPQARNYAEGFRKRLHGLEGRGAVRQAYRIAYDRMPEANELAAAEKFLARQRNSYASEGHGEASALALTDYCQILLSLSEFLYIR